MSLLVLVGGWRKAIFQQQLSLQDGVTYAIACGTVRNTQYMPRHCAAILFACIVNTSDHTTHVQVYVAWVSSVCSYTVKVLAQILFAMYRFRAECLRRIWRWNARQRPLLLRSISYIFVCMCMYGMCVYSVLLKSRCILVFTHTRDWVILANTHTW